MMELGTNYSQCVSMIALYNCVLDVLRTTISTVENTFFGGKGTGYCKYESRLVLRSTEIKLLVPMICTMSLSANLPYSRHNSIPG